MSRGRPKEFVEEEALDQALATFWAHGYGSTGLAELTEAMGIGRQSLYDTFGDKRSLFLRALRSYCDRQFGMVSSVLAGAGTPGERLTAFLDAWVTMYSGPMQNGCLLVSSIGEFAAAGDDEVLEFVTRQMDRFQAMMQTVIQAAIDAGEIDDRFDAPDLTQTLLAAARGLSIQARLGDASDPARAAASSFKALLGL